jgi:hypothetical protein
VSEDMPGTVFLEYVGERKVVRQLGWVQDQLVAATGLRGRNRVQGATWATGRGLEQPPTAEVVD